MNRVHLTATFLACVATGVSSLAAAQPQAYPQPQPYGYPAQPPGAYPAQPPGAYPAPQPMPLPEHVHDGGFYFRLQLGGGYSYTTYADADLTWSGAAVNSMLSLGFSMPSSLALHFDILVDQTLTLDVTYGGASSTSDASYGTSGFGVGGTYYMQSNAFFTGGLGLALASLTDADGTEVAQSDLGMYLTLGAGREWWVARRFAVGVYGRVTLASLPDSGVDARFTTIVPAAGLSMAFD